MEGIETKVKAQQAVPTYEECVEAMARHGAQLSKGVRQMQKDSFSQRVAENKRELKRIADDLDRLKYDSTDVKFAAGDGGGALTNDERHGIVSGIGQIYLLTSLMQDVMDGELGKRLGRTHPEARLVYTFSMEHIMCAARLMAAFTDRFSHNVKLSAKELFGIDLDTKALKTAIDELNIANTVNAFGVRFSRQVEGQKDIAEEHIARQKEELEAEEGDEGAGKAGQKKRKLKKQRDYEDIHQAHEGQERQGYNAALDGRGQIRQDPRRPHEGKGKRGQGDGRGPQRVHGVQQGKDKGGDRALCVADTERKAFSAPLPGARARKGTTGV